jgi:hypothetical protein
LANRLSSAYIYIHVAPHISQHQDLAIDARAILVFQVGAS